LNDDFEMIMDPKSEKDFREVIKRFTVTGPQAFSGVIGRVARTARRHVRAKGYSSSGANSIGVGPGKKYGHVRNSLIEDHGAIGWGGYVRIKFKPGGKGFVARFFEDGTGGGKNRFGNFRGMGIRARHPLDSSYRTLDQNLLDRELKKAVNEALKK